MINKDGVVKILDMGLARSFVNEQDNLTGTIGEEDGVFGTLDYVSPEQAIGQPVDERADLYSLGATLFYLIAGHPPYKGSRTQILLQHQMANPPRLSKTLKVPVPDALNDVIAKMMAKKKSDRYQTAEREVIDALSPWLPAQAHPPATFNRPRSAPRICGGRGQLRPCESVPVPVRGVTARDAKPKPQTSRSGMGSVVPHSSRFS